MDIRDPSQFFLSPLNEKLAQSAVRRRLDAAVEQYGDSVNTPEGAARYLAAIGGTMPGLEIPPRRLYILAQ